MSETGFRSKFTSKCAYGAACTKGGTIQKGELIRWNRAVKGKAWHVECGERGPEGEPMAAEGETMQEINAETMPEAAPQSDLTQAILSAVLPHVKAGVDAGKVKQMVQEAIAPLSKRVDAIEQVKPTRIEIKTPEAAEVKDLGVQHKQFPVLLAALQAKQADGHRLNVWMTGPAGSSKTTSAINAAKALGLEFAFTGAIDTPYPLIGFIDAGGRAIRTPFREVYEKGGVFLFDEYDGSHPSATLPFNAALANGHCAFPDAIVKRHADFIAIAAANTWGLGGTSEYVGRNRLDAASLDRFVCIEWEIDESLEMATVGNSAWVTRVQGVRRNVAREGIKVIISPRASYFGAALLAAGMKQDQVEKITLRKGMTEDTWKRVS